MSRNLINRSIQAFVFTTLVLLATSMVSAQVEATIEKLWLDRDVKVKDETGIRVHVKYKLKNALKVYGSVQVYVERVDNDVMLFKSKGYVYKVDRKILVLTTFTSPYANTTYPDTKIFVPNWAFNLKADNPNKLKFTVEIVAEGKVLARTSIGSGRGLGWDVQKIVEEESS